jgi:lysophospholipase L1-like esterase
MKFFVVLSALALFAVAHVSGEAPAPRFEKDILAFEAADQEIFPPEGAILFIGSSSIRGWRSLADDFPEHAVINRGFGGSHIDDSVRLVDRIVLPYRPSMIVFYAGENDLTAGKSPEKVAQDFRTFVELVRAELPGTRIAFISMKPSPSRWRLAETKREGNRLIRDYVSQAPGVDYIDVFEPMLNDEGQPREELFVGDRLHLNVEGYALWRQIVAPYLAHHAAAQKQ